MPCELCGTTDVARDYTHAKTTHHKKKLFQAMRAKRDESIKKFGFFKWEPDEPHIKEKK